MRAWVLSERRADEVIDCVCVCQQTEVNLLGHFIPSGDSFIVLLWFGIEMNGKG